MEQMSVYRERAALLAVLACNHVSYLYPPDDAEPGFSWAIAIYMGGKQCTWHIADDDLDLFEHVERKPDGAWDGTTTEEKYAALRDSVYVKMSAAKVIAKAQGLI